MKFKRHLELEHDFKYYIEFIPLVNTLFLLFIFFLAASNFIAEPETKVNIRHSLTAEIARKGSIVLIVSKENTVFFNGEALSPASLNNLIQQAAKRQDPVLIKADKQSGLGQVMRIFDICRQAGVNQVNIATDN